MRLTNSGKTYGLIAVLFHWVSAVIAIGLFASGLWMTSLSYGSEWYHAAPQYHKAIGFILAAIILGRLAWKGINTSPEPIGVEWEITVAKIVHAALYLGLFVLFASGYLIATGDGRALNVFDVISVPSVVQIGKYADLAGDIHYWSAMILAGLTALHIVAAFKHQFINRERVLNRIFGL